MAFTITKQLEEALRASGVTGAIEFTNPPKPEMGDFAFACFAVAKERQQSPVEVANELTEKIIRLEDYKIIERVETIGPYVNFFLSGSEIARIVMDEIARTGEKYGTHEIGKGKKYVIEFGCPNPLKAFHLGHLKNLITGESVVRVFENAGYEVTRVNYQGDVGMHVAKALWGIFDWKDKFEAMRRESLQIRVEFLGQAYAHGAARYEASDQGKEEVIAYNDIVYENSDESVMQVYREAREWSLEYFDEIYKRLGSRFDKLYFESDVFSRGRDIVQEAVVKEIFTQSQGAVIFEGSKYGLHDRVFLNSKGFPTYEAKDLALAEAHFKDWHPDKIIHVVGKEQTEYFKVVFKAMEFIIPESVGKEFHLVGGFLQLKGDQKMSSRTGNIVTGDELIEEVRERVAKVMAEAFHEKEVDQADVLEKVSIAALKYGMLKNNVSQDVAFDMEESLSTTGDSGPYLLYFVARINSILRKVGPAPKLIMPETIAEEEKRLILKLAEFGTVTREAMESYDPSKIAKYIFNLAQGFSDFYEACPVVQSEGATQAWRATLIKAVLQVAERGLYLLGIATVEKM